MKIKNCPFNNGKPCMKEDCVLFDEEIAQCEFKNLAKFIGECFDEYQDTVYEKGE